MDISEIKSQPQQSAVNFNDTRIAFAHKNNKELKRTALLFRFMNQPGLVSLGGAIGLWLNQTGIHIFNPLIKWTFFKQFCGGTSLEESAEVLDHLMDNHTYAVLDYGAEGKSSEEDFDQTLEENIKAIKFASTHQGAPLISSKVTALGSLELMEKKQSGIAFSEDERVSFERFENRVNQLCDTALQYGVSVFIDAEETWIQDTIDDLVKRMMEKNNREKVVIYHTYQLYRKDKLKSLMEDHQEARAKGYKLGAKLVRGAYMEKERKRAMEKGYPSPIHDTKPNTDHDYNAAVRYCVDHYEEIASCNASHNVESNRIQAELIALKNIPRDHPHLNFCQLYGMSDNITYNLASAGYNVAKYVPYGPVKEVIPYLIRRAKENTSVTGEMSRELSFITQEMKRRGMK
jgi:proline dehydrogenase